MAQDLAAIILPMYNEELSIPVLQEMFDEKIEMPPGYDYRIVAVNDGSKDRTLELVNKWAQENHRVKVLSHTQNMGVGQAILTGFGEAIRMSSICVVTLHADASHPGGIIKQMLVEVQKGADIVIASRFTQGGKQVGVPLLRRIYGWGARILLSTIFPLKGVRDYTVGFRAYRTTMVNQALSRTEESFLTFRSFATSAEILLKFVSFANKVVEVPLVLRYDHKMSSSKLRTWNTIRDYFMLFMLPKQECPLGRGLAI
ncbi:MAG: glycosyltransferase family 2 protein [Syntrophomonadaceae bacterium]|nr:glycosyltransferase family 2 protein [Syntrophomonadaceae bacterium]